jgi:hypothetical protein
MREDGHRLIIERCGQVDKQDGGRCAKRRAYHVTVFDEVMGHVAGRFSRAEPEAGGTGLRARAAVDGGQEELSG